MPPDSRTARCLDSLCFAASCKFNPPFISSLVFGWPWSLAVPVAFLDVFSFLAGRGLQCYRQASQVLPPSFILICKLSGTDTEVLTDRLRCSFFRHLSSLLSSWVWRLLMDVSNPSIPVAYTRSCAFFIIPSTCRLHFEFRLVDYAGRSFVSD